MSNKIVVIQNQGNIRKRTRYKKQKEEEEKHRSWTTAVWSYLHAAMSLGKRQHEIWTEGGSGRVNKKDKRKQLEQKTHFKHQKLLITTQSLKNKAKLRH